MARYYLLRADGSYSDAGDYPDLPDPRQEGEWIAGLPPEGVEPFVYLNPLQKMQRIITQGQQQMENNRLPKDIRKQIYDLELAATKYYERNDLELLVDCIQDFVIPEERNDVTAEQRGQVEALKTMMMGIFQ